MSDGAEALSISRVARILAVGEALVYRLILKGELPAFRVGRCWRIAVVDLNAFRKRQQYRIVQTTKTTTDIPSA